VKFSVQFFTCPISACYKRKKQDNISYVFICKPPRRVYGSFVAIRIGSKGICHKEKLGALNRSQTASISLIIRMLISIRKISLLLKKNPLNKNLHVPTGTEDLYKADPVWRNFHVTAN
jgi:hypothetical protein